MYINYVKAVNDIYNSTSNISILNHKFTTVASAVEKFVKHSVENGVHPIQLKVQLSNFEERYQFGLKNFGLFYAYLFTMYLNEL